MTKPYAKIGVMPMIQALLITAYCMSVTGCAGPPYAPSAWGNYDTLDGQTQSPVRLKIVRVAETMLGVPYRYGGATPDGFDCSGLAFYSYTRAGIAIPRTTRAQYRQTEPIPSHELQPGDLVFFRLNGREISHVGIYQGGNIFIHAPLSGKTVTRDSLANRYWRERFVRGGRFMS